MNQRDIQEVLKKEPNLGLHGFGFCNKQPGMTTLELLAELKRDQFALLDSAPICSKVCDWLTQNLRPFKKVTDRAGSYSLKHLAERAIGEYVANGQLICSAIFLGYPYSQRTVPGNAIFGISSRDLDRVIDMDERAQKHVRK